MNNKTYGEKVKKTKCEQVYFMCTCGARGTLNTLDRNQEVFVARSNMSVVDINCARCGFTVAYLLKKELA